jgi:hypothetical protein
MFAKCPAAANICRYKAFAILGANTAYIGCRWGWMVAISCTGAAHQQEPILEIQLPTHTSILFPSET